MKKPVIFFDRDGVLAKSLVRNNKAYAPLAPEEFVLVEGAERNIEILRTAGFPCIVVTNQPELERGLLKESVLDGMHKMLRDRLKVDDIIVCPHDPESGCECHKPKPGMLLEARKKWNADLGQSFMVGDRWRDIGAGRAVGCFSILIERPYSACDDADARVGSLSEAVELIMAKMENEERWNSLKNS